MTSLSDSLHLKCGYQDCLSKNPQYQCSRCKIQKYCSYEHQKLDWSNHKTLCLISLIKTTPFVPYCQKHTQREQGRNNETITPTTTATTTATATATVPTPNDRGVEKVIDEKRQCRCMFCGEVFVLGSEEEAINHMQECSSLQEQLYGEGQFTIPSTIQQKLHRNETG